MRVANHFPHTGACLALFLAGLAVACAGTIEVPGDAATVQEAVNSAVAGDVILVAASVAPEDVAIQHKRELTIMGKGMPTMKSFRLIEANSSIVTGFRVENSTGGNGIYLWGCYSSAIVKCAVRNVIYDGILAQFCGGIRIEKCTIEDVGRNGIRMGSLGWEDGRDAVIVGNRVARTARHGLAIAGSRNHVEKNSFTNCGENGCRVETGSENSIVGNRFTGVTSDGLYLASAATGNALASNALANVGAMGIRVAGSSNRFTKNKIKVAGLDGVAVTAGTDCELSGNAVTAATRHGFSVNTGGHTFTQNKAAKCGGFGLEDTAGGNTYASNRFGTTSFP